MEKIIELEKWFERVFTLNFNWESTLVATTTDKNILQTAFILYSHQRKKLEQQQQHHHPYHYRQPLVSLFLTV
jgi:hypothetical protein